MLNIKSIIQIDPNISIYEDITTIISSYFHEDNFIIIDNNSMQQDEISWYHADYFISFYGKNINNFINANHFINIHPAPPIYPGVGGYIHAIYNGDKIYGATCHYATYKNFYSHIIKTKKFKIGINETPYSLKLKTSFSMMYLFTFILDKISMNNIIYKESYEKWNTKILTVNDLDSLFCIDIKKCSDDEIKKKIYLSEGMHKPFIMYKNHKFIYTKE